MNDFNLAMSRYRRRKYKEALELVDQILQRNGQDLQGQILKLQILYKKNQIDELEMNSENIGDLIMQEQQDNQRQGTSNNNNGNNINKMVRPMSKSGRLNTGFQRPGSQQRPDSKFIKLETALKSQRQGTSRPLSQGGRQLRLMTASLQLRNNDTLQVDKLNLKSIAEKKSMSKIIILKKHQSLLYIQLLIGGGKLNKVSVLNLGYCHFLLKQNRDAIRCYYEAIQLQPMIITFLLLNNVFIQQYQAWSSLEILQIAEKQFKNETIIILNTARVYEILQDQEKSINFYKLALKLDQSNLEAISILANHYFYIDQPEVALRLYKKLIMIGVHNSEIYNNLALCCYYNGQYDLFSNFFEQALQLAQDDETISNIWYNISHIFISQGLTQLAEIALKLSLKFDITNYESLNNLGVLNQRLEQYNISKYYYQIAMKEGAFNFEAYYNFTLICLKKNDLFLAYRYITKCLNAYPEFFAAQELKSQIQKQFTAF